jgi:hypothetical protein
MSSGSCFCCRNRFALQLFCKTTKMQIPRVDQNHTFMGMYGVHMAKPATLLIPFDFSFPFHGGGALRYSVPKWLLFLNLCGEWFYCLRSFFFFFTYGIFSRKTTIHTVIYDADIWFWPTLQITLCNGLCARQCFNLQLPQ